MDTDNPEIQMYDDEDSGSDFEASESPSLDELAGARNSRATSERRRSKSSSGSREREILDGDKADQNASETKELVVEDAKQWAANFQPPDPGGVRSPRRGYRKRKSSFPRSANESRVNRAKRLKSFSNNDYRGLLNVDIEDVIAGEIESNRQLLPGSQIGSSLWTIAEKGSLFSALDRMGRDNVAGIAERIGTKSELEVQEYIQLLESGMKERRSHRSHAEELLSPLDFPAAVEISTECCVLLERAGDSIAIRQDLDEERVEKGKWGDLWLLTSSVCRQIDHPRREEDGEEEMQEVLPAANLFNIQNWIELSERIFMNANSAIPEDNWHGLAEPGETPAIRATAMEDFHSLAVSFTMRLISTTLFCTMSRLRARGSNKVKHAEVSKEDVEAAVNILRLKKDTQEFWIKCARRCNLEVINDENDPIDPDDGDSQSTAIMTYQEVEQALISSSGPHSRATSRSRSATHPPTPLSGPSTAVSEAEQAPSEDNDTDSLSSFDHPSQSSRTRKLAADNLLFCTAQDAEMETLDQQASKASEIKLWEMLNVSPPGELSLEMVDGDVDVDEKKRVKLPRGEIEEEGWREKMEFWSSWEMMDTPVSETEFRQNRARKSSRARRREELIAREEGSESSDEDENASTGSEVADQDSDIENIKVENASDEQSGEEDEQTEEQDESDEESVAMYESDDELQTYLAGQADMLGGGFFAGREDLEELSDDGRV